MWENRDFAHLHCHSEGSLIDGLGTVERLVSAAKDAGYTALALTEHGTLSTSATFALVCQRYGIKSIQGYEGYIEVDGERGHITLLADGNRGFNSLINLNNVAQQRPGRRPTFTLDELIDNQAGLVCLTGCLASPLQQQSLGEAVKLGALLKGVFEDRLFAEAMFLSDLPDVVERALHLREALNIPLVVTNDVHFPFQSDAPIHPILTGLKASFEYGSADLWLKGPRELAKAAKAYKGLIDFSLFKEGLALSKRIADSLGSVDIRRPVHLPDIGDNDPNATLKGLVSAALAGRGREYHERAKYELSVIKEMGFSKYFLILLDIINDARGLGSRIGPGRGSGVSSLVLYLLGVTEIDPLVYGLEFERFLNPTRQEYPDVDVDFDSDTRDALLSHVADKWDAYQIATYSTYSHKSLTRDLCKHFKVPKGLTEEAADNGPDSKAFLQICDNNPMFEPTYQAMLGQMRHKGKHAGGVVLSDSKSNLPLERVGDRLCAAWTEGGNRELSEAGFVKFDLLGVSSLSGLRRMESATGERAPFPPPPHDPVFEKIFQAGRLAGIFQFSGSPGVVKLTQEVSPTRFEDLIAINALYRPGPLGAGTAQKFVEWRRSPRSIHPEIDPILEDTYGVITYQEQVMHIVAKVTGGSLADADTARKLFSKPKPGNAVWEGKVAALKEVFLDKGAATMGPKLAAEIWEELQAHSKYSFNKSHSAAYARIAWEMAWFKLHYPAAFYSAMLNIDPGNAQEYLYDAVSRGLKLKAAHINISGYEYEARGNDIYMPINSVKWLGESGARALVEAREEGGEFKSLNDYMARVPKRSINKRARLGLYALGGFEGVPGEPGALELGELPQLDPQQVQRDYLGFVLPTPDLIQRAKAFRKMGYKAGIVRAISERDKGRGPYSVYYLTPSGVFWKRGGPEAQEGDFIYASLGKSGQAKVIHQISS